MFLDESSLFGLPALDVYLKYVDPLDELTDYLPHPRGNGPVVVDPAVSAYSGLIIDRSQVVAAVGPVLIATSEHSYFSSDSVAIRGTWRVGWNLVRPYRCAKFTIDDGS